MCWWSTFLGTIPPTNQLSITNSFVLLQNYTFRQYVAIQWKYTYNTSQHDTGDDLDGNKFPDVIHLHTHIHTMSTYTYMQIYCTSAT